MLAVCGETVHWKLLPPQRHWRKGFDFPHHRASRSEVACPCLRLSWLWGNRNAQLPQVVRNGDLQGEWLWHCLGAAAFTAQLCRSYTALYWHWASENWRNDFEPCGFDIKSGVDESPLQNCYLTLTKNSSVSPFEFGSETFTSNGLSAFSETWLGSWKIRPSLMGVPKTFKAVVKPCSASKE